MYGLPGNEQHVYCSALLPPRHASVVWVSAGVCTSSRLCGREHAALASKCLPCFEAQCLQSRAVKRGTLACYRQAAVLLLQGHQCVLSLVIFDLFAFLWQ